MTFINVATSAPAGVISSLIMDVVRGVQTAFERVSRYRDYSRAEAQLRAMTDRELDDLGIGRSDIRARVWANYGSL